VQQPPFLSMLNALVYFCGCPLVRESSLLLLYVMTYEPLWICTKVSKSSVPNQKEVTLLIPDFCQEAIVPLVPYTIQAIRMPLREDLLLSQEQQLYVSSHYGKEKDARAKADALRAVASQVQTADKSGIWRRYVIARGGVCPEL
jgi:hypothetical protein